MKYIAERLIGQLNNAYSSVINEYENCYKEVGLKDQETTDIEHVIEMAKLNAPARLNIFRELKDCRVSRRELRDQVEALEPLYKFMKRHEKIFHKLPKLQSKIADKINHHQQRKYTARVRTDLIEKYLEEGEYVATDYNYLKEHIEKRNAG